MEVCPHCQNRVLVSDDGTCPACRSRFFDEAGNPEETAADDGFAFPGRVAVPAKAARPGGLGMRVPDWLVRLLTPRVAQPLVLAVRVLLIGVGQLLVLLAWGLFMGAMAYRMPQYFHPLWILLAIPGALFGIFLVVQSRRLREGLASLTLSPALCGRCLLYLRSFQDDHSVPETRPGTLEKIPLFSLFAKTALSHEGELAKGAPFRHPLVALGPPGERLPPGGALRLYFSHSEWKTEVDRLLPGVELAILRVGNTPSLALEMDMLRNQLPPSRVVLFHPDPAQTGHYSRFRAAAGAHLPHGLPEEWPFWWPPFLIFDDEWRAAPLPDVALRRRRDPLLLNAIFSLFYGSGKITSNDHRLRYQISQGEYRETLRWLMARANGGDLSRYEVIE